MAATQAACTGRARLKAVGGRGTHAERTMNIPRMVVTLDVSKLSGWLNANAFYRVERRACDEGSGTAREAGGGGRPRRGTQRAGQGSTADWGQGTEWSAP